MSFPSIDPMSDPAKGPAVPRPARHRVWHHTRRTAIFLVGTAVALAGVAMLVLPGPGLLLVVAGLSILAVEFAWAARWRDRAKERTTAATRAVSSSARRMKRRRRS